MQPNASSSRAIRKHSENHLTKFLEQSELGLNFFLGIRCAALAIGPCKHAHVSSDPRGANSKLRQRHICTSLHLHLPHTHMSSVSSAIECVLRSHWTYTAGAKPKSFQTRGWNQGPRLRCGPWVEWGPQIHSACSVQGLQFLEFSLKIQIFLQKIRQTGHPFLQNNRALKLTRGSPYRKGWNFPLAQFLALPVNSLSVSLTFYSHLVLEYTLGCSPFSR